MRLTDELKEAREKIEVAMSEQSRHDEARCASAGKRHMLEITRKGDQEPVQQADK